jgi:CRISPR-associated protein Cmr3
MEQAAMSQTHSITCHFAALDTWFFREARPHGSVGSSELASVFPPPLRTLLGALRTLIGDSWFARHGGDWRGFKDNPALQAIIGFGDDLGPLRVSGPFLRLHGKRLHPAPANLMVKEQGGAKHYFLLDLSGPVRCDLGRVHLPAFPQQVAGLDELAGSKPVQDWLSDAGLQAVLEGRSPAATEVVHSEQLFAEEPRLGIGRDNSRNSVQEGLLYQTRHLRLQAGVTVELQLHGLSDPSLLPEQTTLRLGGEGRMAGLRTEGGSAALGLPVADIPAAAFAIYALTPMVCAAELPAGVPAGFVRSRHQDADVWEGRLGDLELRLLSVACQRPVREGGWDMASHQARPVLSLLAPGSVIYVQSRDGRAPTAAALQQALASLSDASGRGLLVAGRLPSNTSFQG